MTQDDDRLTSSKTVRDKGRFAPGTAPGPGRPPRSREERYLELTIKNCSESDWAQIVQRAVKQAIEGDDKARTWLGKLLIGDRVRLSQDVSVTTNVPDGPESTYRQYSPTTARLIEQAIVAIGTDEGPERN